MTAARSDAGNGTVLGLLLVALGLLAAGCILLLLAATHAAVRAGTAADLAAVAAADAARGLRTGAPCAVARAVSTANAAQLRECQVEGTGDTVRLTVSVEVSFGFTGIRLHEARASARAGPPSLR